MVSRPCPICKKPTTWEDNPWKPFCSERCKTRDLGAWSSEAYRVPVKPDDAEAEAWSGEEDEDAR
ncbi:MAG: DNA gyrase inhibitor YacG [Acidobacteriota bacterium]|nr:DNA gyrase inhibitor YacG [Acidobacteriota bacterium]